MDGRAPANGHRLPFEPALDGLRGIGMLATLCFHAEFAWAMGSFLAISMFFTLSGYLITALFLIEWERTGEIRLGKFWGRRFRRLMPGALLTLAGMSVFGAFVATPDQIARLRGDVVWALFYGANWHFLASDAAYTRLFEAPSPVQHFWSLAIEEQFYAVFPLLVLGCLRFLGSRAAFGGILLGLLALSIATSVWLTVGGASIDRTYYGSDIRATELLVGALLAVVARGGAIVGPALRRTVEWLGVPALFTMLGLWMTVDLSSRWLYLGGFGAYAILSAFVITAGVQPAGFVRAFLSARPLCWIGRISYGAYLVHWPIFLWLNEARTGLPPVQLFALRVLVTFVVAELSYRYFEAPIRSGRRLTGWRPFVLTPIAFACVVLAVTVVTRDVATSGGAVTEEDVQRIHTLIERARNFEVPADEPAPSLRHTPPRMAIFGDSTAVTLGLGLGDWLENTADVRVRLGVAELGCGVARHGQYRVMRRVVARPRHCKDRETAWPEALRSAKPDVVIFTAAPWDVSDRKLPGDAQFRAPGDPVLDAYLRKELLAATDILLKQTPLVIWLTHPAVDVRDRSGVTPDPPFPEADPERMRHYNEFIFELESLRPGRIRVVDLARYMRTLPGGELDPRYRPDGTHLSLEGSVLVARDWLGEEIMRVYREEAARVSP